MAQTNQPMGSSPLANMMQQGQVYRGPLDASGRPMQAPGTREDLGGGVTRFTPTGGWGAQGGQQPMGAPSQDMRSQLMAQMGGAQTPQVGDRVAKMQQNLSAIQGMQPNQIPRMPGMQPPAGAPGQGPGGAKAPGTPGGAQQVRQQMARLPGGPQPGAPAAGPGAGKAAGTPQMKQQIARLPMQAGQAIPR